MCLVGLWCRKNAGNGSNELPGAANGQITAVGRLAYGAGGALLCQQHSLGVRHRSLHEGCVEMRLASAANVEVPAILAL